jgi:hypothetical protein
MDNQVPREAVQMSIQAIIFDVDGTLADTEDGHRIAFNQAFAEQRPCPGTGTCRCTTELLAVTGGKERIRYYLSDFLTGFARPADFDGFVRRVACGSRPASTRPWCAAGRSRCGPASRP